MKLDFDRIRQAKRAIELVSRSSVSIDRALAAVSPIGGTVFDMKLKQLEGKIVWRVKILRGGERVKVYVDAMSGHVIEAKAEISVSDPSPV